MTEKEGENERKRGGEGAHLALVHEVGSPAAAAGPVLPGDAHIHAALGGPAPAASPGPAGSRRRSRAQPPRQPPRPAPGCTTQTQPQPRLHL